MNTLLHKLFLRYAALIFPVIIIFMILLYVILGNTLHENASSELQADCDNVSTLLETEIDQVDTLSQHVVSSAQIRSLFLEDLYSYGPSSCTNRSAFSTALFDVIKLSFNNMSLHMLDTSGRHIFVGSITSYRMEDPAIFYETPWFQSALDAYGAKIVTPPRIPELDPGIEPVISLCRAFSTDSSVNKTAVLEMQLQYSYISQKIQDAIHNPNGEKQIYVYNSDGELIYPYDSPPSEDMESYLLRSLLSTQSPGTPVSYKSGSDPSSLVAWRTSELTDWTVFVTASDRMIFSAYYEFRNLIIVVAFLVLLFLLFITWQIASRIAAPLQKLEQAARSLTLDNLATAPMPDYNSGFREMDSLFHSFQQMQLGLQKSLQETVAAHTMANNAKMIALQAQMSPHFLYNTLASISVLAEDGDSEKVIQMCTDLSSLLRYCSSGTSMNADMKSELDNLLAYIHLIKVKYEDRIQFHIDIDKKMLSLDVPRLLLQPLVENCVKYALTYDPPWIISIKGTIRARSWIVKIQDNGAGFSEDYLSSFGQKIRELNPETPLPSINGMGLFNLYMRLYLRYKDDIIFKLENLPEGGACVTAGGPLDSGGNTDENSENKGTGC